MSMPAAVVEQYKLSQRLQVLAQIRARRAWSAVQVGLLSQSWEVILRNSGLVDAVSTLQVEAATAGASYGALALASQGDYVAPDSFVNASAFGGYSADGRSLSGAMYSAVPYTKNLIAGGMSPTVAKVKGGAFLELKVKTEIADAGRGAASVDIATRTAVGYVRMLNPPSCSRCSVMAGRFYRWNAGFLRHPGCDCIHVPSKGADAARAEGLIHDPYEYFNGLSAADQDRLYTKAGAQAIRDGGDLFQVVNSRRGMKPGGLMTTEGTSKRGNFRQSAGDSTRGRRLTPEAIYKLNGDNRAAALKDLEKYGYILPGGQNPLGSITGQREGYGALGHGGSYGAARKRVEDAIKYGRDPAVRATMTEAERRLFDAKARWELVQQGVNPYGAPSMTPRAKINTSPLTPQIAAQVEKDYRRWLSTGGQVFK
ncbi:MAG: hypothetical protein U1A07_26515 [Phenylobacterium sp.]|nr:hypothetical protein [Phenylobacterium sp.]